MTTQTISKQHTGGAMERKDQPEWMTDGRLVGRRPRFRSNHMTSTTCRENNARTEVPEECCENGGLDAFDDNRRDTFMTRSPLLVRFHH
jgi:hypothetical protein